MLSLRPYYHPMQSVIPAEEKEVTYTEFLPCEALRPFIYCYWELKSPPRNTPFFYRVVADGCIDLFFECDNPQMSSLMGYCNTYVEIPIMGAFHYVGVRFLPSAFPLLFGQDAFEISAQEIPLREVVPALATFITQQLGAPLSLPATAQHLDDYFLRHLSQHPLQIDNRFFSALSQILQSKGTIHISELNTGISPRQLRRLFDYYIGDNPKTFSNIVRFQHILSAKAYHNHSFLDTYYDQAHFIKSFKTFYGDTPSKVLG
ncbi:AraC family transcriptional regulator [Capnocytophaga leadbetteri]